MEGPPRPRRLPPAVRGVLAGLAAVALLAGAAAGWVWWQLQPTENTPRPVEVEVLPGWGAARIAAELKEHGLIRNARVFVQYLRFSGLDRNLGEGLYDLNAAFSAAQTAAVLGSPGRPRLVRVVIPEGFRAVAVIGRLVDAGFGTPDDYAELAPALLEERGWYEPEAAADPERRLRVLEGFLFPASYDLPVRSTPGQVLGWFLDRFSQELGATEEERLEELGLSLRDWVTLASLVQAEAGTDAEMPVIAGVFLNRLAEGMPLQSDPTVAYGLDKALPELDVQAGDMRDAHPWNTYVHPGIPPTPIGNPGHAALSAVLAADRTAPDGEPWLYFLHGRQDGEPVFRPNTNYAAHVRDIELFLR